jgi:Tfp pilus assembly protein PilX
MKKILNVFSLSRGTMKRQLQKGLVLEIVLVVLIAILFATMGLYRSVDTSTGIAGNMAFKRDAENRAQVAVNEVLTWVEDNANYQDFIISGVDDPTNNFSARMLQTSANGIPIILSGDAGVFDAAYTKAPTAQMDDDSAKMRVRYVIERMCTRDGAISSEYCSASAGTGMGTQPGKNLGGASRPLLRVSIRVDGPRDTVAYAQAMIDP